jgi:hypothetical protein
MNQVKKYFFSEEASKEFGYVIAKNPNGKEFKYSAIYDDDGSNYKWIDKVLVGEFDSSKVKFIRIVTPINYIKSKSELFEKIKKLKKVMI